MTVKLRRVALDDVPWNEINARADRTVFQTRPWLDFLTASQTAEPVVAQVWEGSRHVGWFSGAVVRRAGVAILGSPLPGWTTSYMGFSMDRPVDTSALLKGLADFAFGALRCVHLEVMDRNLVLAADSELPGRATMSLFHSSQLILRDDDSMLAGMTQNARRNIRRAESKLISVQDVDPQDAVGFVAEFYAQIRQAFAKRRLVPTFGPERVSALIEHLHPTGQLLLVRAHTSDGRCAATGIFPGMPGSMAVFWMGASDPALLDGRPNEAVMWYAIRTWRDRGAAVFDFGGGGEYKAKYGGTPIEVPWIRWSRFAGVESIRELVRRGSRSAQITRGRLTIDR